QLRELFGRNRDGHVSVNHARSDEQRPGGRLPQLWIRAARVDQSSLRRLPRRTNAHAPPRSIPPIITTIITTITTVIAPPMPPPYPGLWARSRSTIPHFEPFTSSISKPTPGRAARAADDRPRGRRAAQEAAGRHPRSAPGDE